MQQQRKSWSSRTQGSLSTVLRRSRSQLWVSLETV